MGFENSIYVNTNTTAGVYDYAEPHWVEVDLARDVTNNNAIDKIDATSRRTARKGMRAYVYGLGDKGFSFDSLVPMPGETDAAFDALRDAQRLRENVDILVIEGGGIDEANLEVFRMICGVFGGDESEPKDELKTISYECAFALNSDMDVPIFGATTGAYDETFVDSSTFPGYTPA